MIQPQLRTIRILIADDHGMLREGFRNLLRRNTEIEFAGEASNGKELVEMTGELLPDIVFMDIQMPVMNGIEAARIIHQKYPDTKIIALTSFEQEHFIVDMIDAGASGYLLKNAGKEEILLAIHTVYNNNTYYCRQVSSKIADMVAAKKLSLHKKEKPGFSERELQVITLICRQLSNKEIASSLHLSIRTIEGYREKIQDKMDVRSTAGLVVYAIQKGLYTPGE